MNQPIMIEGLRRSRTLIFPAQRNTRRRQLGKEVFKWVIVAVVAWLVSGVLRAQEFRVEEALARMEASAYGYVPSVSLDIHSEEASTEPHWFSFDHQWSSIKSGFGGLVSRLKFNHSPEYGDGPALMAFIRNRIYNEEEAGLLFKRRLFRGERSLAHVRAGYGLYFGPSTIPTTQPCVGGEQEPRFFYLKASFHF